MKKLAKDIHGCDECPLNGNDCNPNSWDGREGPCHSWNGDEIIQPYMYSVAAELHETKADKAKKKQIKKTREQYSGFDFHSNMLKQFIEQSELYNGNIKFVKRDRATASISYGGFTPYLKLDLRNGKFYHPFKFTKNYYYMAYMLSNDFYKGYERTKKWAKHDALMYSRPEDENFYRGFEKFEKDFYLYLVSNYRVNLEMELSRLGAKQSDFGLISDELIKNAIKLGRKPKDVVWGIVQ